MRRRAFLKTVAAGASVGVLTSNQPVAARAAKDRPNVLVIHTDQHRIDCLGAYGNRQIQTPHLDALAADGVRYDNSFCSYPVCTPSRYSLITGLPVFEHCGWTNHCTLPPGTPTLPRMLQEAGYKTKAVGKMHYTPTYADVGFDEMELAEQHGAGRWDDDYHRYLMRLGLVDRNDLEDQLKEYRQHARDKYWSTVGALPSNLPEQHHSTTWIGDRAMDELGQWGASSPRMLMVGFIKPHHPFDPPRRWAEKYSPDDMSILPGWTDECFGHDLAFSRGYFPHADLTRLLFDLENDPLEMNDLSADPARRSEVRRLADALGAWRPADRLRPPYLDEDAPQIDRPNVPSGDRKHRQGIIEYYKTMMAKNKP